MSTKTETPEIKLSDAEIEMIQINRQKAELAKQEVLAKKKIDDEKKIEAGKKRVLDIKAANVAFIAVVRAFFNQMNIKFPGLYEFKETKTYQHVQERNWYYKGKDVPEGTKLDADGEHETLFDEKVDTFIPSIVRIGTKIYVDVKSVQVKDNSRYSKRNVDKMFIHGLWEYTKERVKEVGYINIDTVHTRINETLEAHNSRNNAASILKEGWNLALKQLTAQYPEAEVTQETLSSGRYNHRGRYNSSETKVIKAKFKNGLEVMFSFHYWNEKGTMTLRIDDYDMNTGNLKFTDIVNALKDLKPTK